jgi:hypothetical protein
MHPAEIAASTVVQLRPWVPWMFVVVVYGSHGNYARS